MASVSPPAGLSRQPDQEGSKENTAPTSTSPQLKVSADYDSEELDRDLTATPVRMQSKKSCTELLDTALHPDRELMRGIPLRRSLFGLGRLWRFCPADLPEKQRAALWEFSATVESFDIFLSHSWRTKGWRKVLALTLRFGWPHCVASWLFFVLVAELLSFAGILPMKGMDQVQVGDEIVKIPFGAWGYVASMLSLVVLLIWPYFPAACGGNQRCFLDVTSINQVDMETMERGIYGLGGFLACSDQLLILWSRPYLSRLWCVFEIAAYKRANPSGKITLAPLFVETGVAAMYLCGYFIQGLHQFFVQVLGINGVVKVAVGVLPAFWVIPALRSEMRVKRQLISDLRNFKLESVHCQEDFDREYIHTAITRWYGSHGAFEAFVRGPLRQELVASQEGHFQLPFVYSLIIAIPQVAAASDHLVGLMMVSDESVPLYYSVSYLVGTVLGTFLFGVMVLSWLIFFLCSYFDGASSTSRLMEFGRNFLIVFVLLAFSLGAILIGQVSQRSLKVSLAWFLTMFLAVWLIYGGWKKMAALCSRDTVNQATQPALPAQPEREVAGMPQNEEQWEVTEERI